jgi:hypothetical protein
MGSDQYVIEAVGNVSIWLEGRGLKLKTKAPLVLPTHYKPVLDTSKWLNEEDANYYQQQIGVL